MLKKTIQILFIFLLLMILGFILMVQSFPPLFLKPIAYSQQILSSEGHLLRLYTTPNGYWRLPTKLDQVDPKMIKALLSYEDQRFYQHSGIDFRAILRASLQLLKNQKLVSGASTITMQTIRLLKPKPRTLKNKLLEMYQAWHLEQIYSKQQILALYLSLTPYGGNIQGLTSACLFYFQKSPAHLTLSEIALLIALPQAPESRRPDRHPIRAKKARQHVLKQLFRNESIQLAQNQSIITKRRTPAFYALHLSQQLHQKKLNIIKTTLNFKLQKKLEKIAQAYQQTLAQGVTIAVLVVEKKSAKIIAYLGSGDFYQQSQMDLTLAIRSPGSTLKPFIYGLGFELGLIHPQTKTIDQRESIAGYRPQNFAKKYYGEVTLTQALRASLNIPAVKVLQKVGAQKLMQRFEDNQIQLTLAPHSKISLALALGGIGTNLQQLVTLYNGLARGGKQSVLCVIEPCLATETALLSNKATWYLDQILATTIAPKGFHRQQPLRFKTGTSYGFRDAWSIGYNNAYTVGVWVGRPDGGFRSRKTGLNSAAPLLFQIFSALPKKKDQKFPKKPTDVLVATNQQLPLSMRWLEKRDYKTLKNIPPKIQFPLDKSKLVLAPAISLKVTGGKLPFHWLINNKPLKINSYQRSIQWMPKGAGFIALTVIDNTGRADKITIELIENKTL